MDFTQIISLIGHNAFLSSVFLIMGIILASTTFVVHRNLVYTGNVLIKVSRVTLVIGTLMSAFYFSIAMSPVLMF